MCILFIYLNQRLVKNEYKVIIASNREESYERPTKEAHFLEKKQHKIIAGIDMTPNKEGGTWLGASENGKIASLLNVIKGKVDPNAKSRGFLVIDFLTNDEKAEEFMNKIINSETLYDSFNLVTLEQFSGMFQLTYMNYLDKSVQKFDDGVHGFGNTSLENPLRKVKDGKKEFEELLGNLDLRKSNEDNIIKEVQKFMQSIHQFIPDEVLETEGKSYPAPALAELSKRFVRLPNYGTRTTSVILVDDTNKLVYREKTLVDPLKSETEWKETTHIMQLK